MITLLHWLHRLAKNGILILSFRQQSILSGKLPEQKSFKRIYFGVCMLISIALPFPPPPP